MKRIVVLAIFLMAGGFVHAADAPGPARGPFDKGAYNFALTASYLTPARFSEDELLNLNVSAGYFLWDSHSINLELQGYWADQDADSDVWIGGIGLLGRWHFYRASRWSLFIDGGGGVVYADQEFPQHPYNGTNFNLTGKVGAGATYEIGDDTHLIGGVRYFHLSNGQIRKRDDNPTYDGVQIWGGVMWTW